jgi:hypothetical protein
MASAEQEAYERARRSPATTVAALRRKVRLLSEGCAGLNSLDAAAFSPELAKAVARAEDRLTDELNKLNASIIHRLEGVREVLVSVRGIEPLLQAVGQVVGHGVSYELGVFEKLTTLGYELAPYPEVERDIGSMFDSVLDTVTLLLRHLFNRYLRLVRVNSHLKVPGNSWLDAVRLADEEVGVPEDENDSLI